MNNSKIKFIDIAILCIALSIGVYFYFDHETRISNHLLAAMDYTGTTVVEIDASGKIIGASRNVEKLTGWNASELGGRPLTILMTEKAKSLHPTEFTRNTPIVTIFQCEIVRRDQSKVHVNIIARIGGGKYIATIDRYDQFINHQGEK